MIGRETLKFVSGVLKPFAFKVAVIVIVSHSGSIGLRRVRPVRDIPDTFQSFEMSGERQYQTFVQECMWAARSVDMKDMPAA